MTLTPRPWSSGDLIADRRFAYAQDAYRQRDFQAAAEMAVQSLERATDFPPALALQGKALAKLGLTDAGIAFLERALAQDPEDRLGIRLDLARLGAAPTGMVITESYIRALFDAYANGFEAHLIETLDYRGPRLLGEAIGATQPGRSFERALDLGCGTGLMGKVAKPYVTHLEGCDLSPEMVRIAQAKEIYDVLHIEEVVRFLRRQPAASADLVVAADVLVYFADLDPVLSAATGVLKEEGIFAFTAQSHDGDGFRLGEDARYGHSESYLRETLFRNGLTARSFDSVSVRKDRGKAVGGFIVIASKHSIAAENDAR